MDTAPTRTEAHADLDYAYRDFFEQGTVSFHWVGPDGTILRANRAELELLGYAEDEYVGHNIADFHADPEVIADILGRLTRAEPLVDYEARLVCKDGSTKYVAIDSSVLRRSDGEFIHSRCITRDVTDRRRIEEAAFRLAAIVDSSDDAIIRKDLDGIVQSWNPAAERIFGFTADEMIGRSIRTIIPAEHQDEEDLVLSRIRAGQRVEHFETERLRKDGSIVPVSLTVSPVRDNQGRVIAASKIARDITEKRAAEAAMRESMALKDEFLGLVSHELRTPIATILGNSQLLDRRWERLPAEHRQAALGDIVGEATRLEHIIENLLVLTRLNAAPLRVELHPMGALLQQLLAPLARANADRSILFEPHGDQHVNVDPDLLAQVMQNLIGNAKKYSPPGSAIEVTVERPPSGAVEVHVLDRGIGVDPQHTEHVFDAFYRTESGRNSAPGMGLGLAVCRKIVEAMGGAIRVVPRPGGGSDFSFTLPESTPPATA